jgi:hypothetical protein
LFDANSYDNIVVAFLILPIGIVIAVLILIIERAKITKESISAKEEEAFESPKTKLQCI